MQLQGDVFGIHVVHQGLLEIHLNAVLMWRGEEGSIVETCGQSLADGIDAGTANSFVEAIFDNDLRNDVRMWRKETSDGTLMEAIRLESVVSIRRTEGRSITPWTDRGPVRLTNSRNLPPVQWATDACTAGLTDSKKVQFS